MHGTDTPVQKHPPFVLVHVHLRGVRLRPKYVALYIECTWPLEPERPINITYRVLKHCYRPQTKFAKVMFLHMSVCPQGGLQAHTRGRLRGRGWGSPGAHRGSLHSHPGKGGSLGPHPGGGIPACTEADLPPCRRLLLRAIRILLECILVLTLLSGYEQR